jgi:TonB-dependent starch-binding outer membrane protein SusC
LSSINMNTKSGFKWTSDFNFAINREEITELQNPLLTQNIADGWFVGQPLTVIYDVKKTGIWQTSEKDQAAIYGRVPGQIKTEDINNDKKIDANDRQIVGNFQPKWTGGLTNRFSYKGFDLSFVIHARMGQTVVAPYLMSDAGAQGYPFFNNGRVNSLKRDYWTPTNPTNEFPRPDASSDATLFSSTLAYVDGSFVKVRSIEAGYLVAPKLLGKSGISSLRLFVNVVNPFILYAPFVAKGYGMDPEGNGYGGVSTSQVGGTPVPGRAITVNLNNPPTRQFNFGLNVKF